MVRSLFLNLGLPSTLWCYAAEAAADIYQYTYHLALQKTPYEAWYGLKPHIVNLCVWGCYVYVCLPDPKKLDHRVTRGHFLGFTKSHLIIRWYDSSTKTVKHASAVCFNKSNTKLTESDVLSPGALILSGITPSFPDLPLMLIFVIIHILVVHLLPFPCNYLLKVLVWAVTSVQIHIITIPTFHLFIQVPL